MNDSESCYSVLFVCNNCSYFWISSYLFDNSVRCCDCESADVSMYPITCKHVIDRLGIIGDR